MSLKDEIKWMAIAGGAPCIGFTIGVILGFIVFPYDVDGASKTLMICAGTGAMVGIFLMVHRLRRAL